MNSAIMMLEETAARLGDKIAVQDEWGEISFSDLRAKAMSIGTGLIAGDKECHGFMPVIVYLPKSISSIVCFAGSMYSGNPYVPVDAAIPVKRLQNIIINIRQGHIITDARLAKNLEGLELYGMKPHLYDELTAVKPDEPAIMEKVAGIIDSDPVYIMYTSGSTGVPKGVTIPHRGIIDYADWLCRTFGFNENTILGNQSAFYFDNSTFDIYTMFRTGAKMIIIPEVLFRYPTKLPQFIDENRINTIFWVPTVMISVANSGALDNCSPSSLRAVLFCGEAMPNKQLNIWRRHLPDILYANLYGPTEITDVCTYYIVDRKFDDTEPLPIGVACRNMRTQILTPDNRIAATSETGELCILGSALSLGYWNSPDLTRKAFVQNPLCTEYDERMYRTGDLAFVGTDGNIIFVGRMDSQIKLRGNRIELGEIETAAKSLPDIKNACVIFDAKAQEIVLFAQSEADINLRRLNMELKKIIPPYMLPGRLVKLPELPLTPNGKIDRLLLKSTL